MSHYTFARFPNTHTVHIVAPLLGVCDKNSRLYCAEGKRRTEDFVTLSASEAREVSAIEICPNCQKKIAPPKPQRNDGAWRSQPATAMQCAQLANRMGYTPSLLQGMTQGRASDILNPSPSVVGFLASDPKNAQEGKV